MSTIGFADRLGTDVEPTCSIATACPSKIEDSRRFSTANAFAQPGLYSESSTGSEGPFTVFLHHFAVALDPAALPQVLDHVPVNRAHVLAADRRQPGADRQMNRPVHLLVEQRVLHVPLDSGVAADPVFAQDPRALVPVELGEQGLLVR